MFFPFAQHTKLQIKNRRITSVPYILNILESAMEDSRMTQTSRTENTIRYAKTDLLKYPHPRNLLHNVSFEVATEADEINIKISTKNWEVFALGILFGIILLLNEQIEKMVLLPVFFIVLILMMGVKQYLLRVIKSNLLVVLGD